MGIKKTTASFFPELTDTLKDIINDIAEKIIKEGQPHIVIGKYNWHTEMLSLLAKQVNLCDSCILLLENGMEQEAYLLARSQFNNMLWIKYICDDSGEDHVKEYFYQQHINQIINAKKLKKLIEENNNLLDSRFDNNVLDSLNKNINDNKRVLKNDNVEPKAKSVSELSKQDKVLFGMYLTLYNEGSKFEHSDISKMQQYRKPIVEGYSENQVFVIDMGTSNINDWLSVFRYSFYSVFFSFESIDNRINNRESHLFLDTAKFKAAYKKRYFEDIMMKLGTCQIILEKAEKQSKENM